MGTRVPAVFEIDRLCPGGAARGRDLSGPSTMLRRKYYSSVVHQRIETTIMLQELENHDNDENSDIFVRRVKDSHTLAKV
jgi:hypothetical protein